MDSNREYFKILQKTEEWINIKHRLFERKNSLSSLLESFSFDCSFFKVEDWKLRVQLEEFAQIILNCYTTSKKGLMHVVVNFQVIWTRFSFWTRLEAKFPSPIFDPQNSCISQKVIQTNCFRTHFLHTIYFFAKKSW